MTFSADLPLEAPSLLSLSAAAVAKGAFISVAAVEPCASLEDDEDELMGDLDAEASGIHLPLACSEALLQARRASDAGLSAETLWAFVSSRLPLTSLRLDDADADLDDELLCRLLRSHGRRLRSLSLVDCANVRGDALRRHLGDVLLVRLHTLALNSVRSVAAAVDGDESMESASSSAAEDDDSDAPMDERDALEQCVCTIVSQAADAVARGAAARPPKWADVLRDSIVGRCPNLSNLILHGATFADDLKVDLTEAPSFLSAVLDVLPRLRYLDLSHWRAVEDLRFVRPLACSLGSLILYEVPDLYRAVDTICELVHLRCLDVSQSTVDTGTYPRPVTALNKLVRSLPLEYLDISSTNLAARPSKNDWPHKESDCIASDIAGLCCLRRPLNFLGLVNCDNASHFKEIPALEVTGDANEDQIVLSLRTYVQRYGLLEKMMNEAYQLYRFGENHRRPAAALHLILAAMRRHERNANLQIAGSASLYYVMRQVEMSAATKRLTVGALLRGMEAHANESVMVRNCCLSLCHFDIPLDLMFDYGRAARLLVHVLDTHWNEQLCERIVVYLLNQMACHVEGDQKVLVGHVGAIQVILRQIERKQADNVCDDVMEVAWSFLWNITDETPVNCERFLDGGGLDLFFKCYQSFTTIRKLTRNMMGLMGNIAEVQYLRGRLMQLNLLEIFESLLSKLDDDIEISYNSAGVLAQLLSDGESAWTHVQPRRATCSAAVVAAIGQWRLDARRYINYRSFGPILRLVPLADAPAAQLWAVWALANLTGTDPDKYCAYVQREGGVELLVDVAKAGDGRVADGPSSTNAADLAQLVLANLRNSFVSLTPALAPPHFRKRTASSSATLPAKMGDANDNKH